MIICGNKSVKDVLNEVLDKLIEQGGQCYDHESNNCVLSDGDGKHCAFGWLLPDDNPVMDSDGCVADIIKKYDDLGPNDTWIRANDCIIGIFQSFHDDASIDHEVWCMFYDRLKGEGVDETKMKKFIELCESQP